jgi:hypothetical protein
VLVAGLACRLGKSKATGDAGAQSDPTMTAEEALREATKDGGRFEGATLRVSGRAANRRGGTAIQCVDLEAGSQKLPACMKAYNCLRGTCVKDAPQNGAQVTLECTGTILLSKPMLTQCEER